MSILKPRTFTMCEDSAHGWLSVPRKLIDKYGLKYKISSYSYQKKTRVYLEEDCDARLFIDELEKRKLPYHIKSSYTEKSRIRGYQGYDSDEMQLRI